MQEEIKELKRQIKELQDWKEAKTKQQISFPLDEASRNAINAGGSTTVELVGAGSTALTQEIALSGDPQNINVPNAYVDTVVLTINGVNYEIPYIA